MSGERDMRPLAIWEIALVSAASVSIALVLVALIVFWWIDDKLISSLLADAPTSGDNNSPTLTLDQNSYLAIITNFYGTLVTVLIFVLSLMSVFAFVFIRSNTVAHVGEKVEEFVPTYFKDGAGYGVLEATITKIETPLGEKIREDYRALYDKVDVIEFALEDAGILINEKLEDRSDEAENQ